MPISAAGSNERDITSFGGRSAEHGFVPFSGRSAEHGFTLVELMVVVTIIALASAVAVWALPDPHGRVVDEAAQFAARVRAAHDSAIVEARPVSVWITGSGYGFDRRIAGGWTPIAEKPLRVERWSDGTGAAFDDATGRVRVTFDPTGLADRATSVTLTRKGASAGIRVGADGEVRLDR